jgi:uridine kinase
VQHADTVEAITAAARASTVSGVRLIGIDGPSGAGKSLAGWKTVAPHPFVVLEGVTCTRRAISDRLAVRVWVDAPADERLRRGIERDGESHRHLWERWMPDEAEFFARDGTRARADFIVDGAAGTPGSAK